MTERELAAMFVGLLAGGALDHYLPVLVRAWYAFRRHRAWSALRHRLGDDRPRDRRRGNGV